MATLEQQDGTRVVYKHVFHTGEQEIWRDAAMNAAHLHDGLHEDGDDDSVYGNDHHQTAQHSYQDVVEEIVPQVSADVADSAAAAVDAAVEAEHDVTERKSKQNMRGSVHSAATSLSAKTNELDDAEQAESLDDFDNFENNLNIADSAQTESLELESDLSLKSDIEDGDQNDDNAANDGEPVLDLSLDDSLSTGSEQNSYLPPQQAPMELEDAGEDLESDDSGIDDVDDEEDDHDDGSGLLKAQVKPASKRTFSYYRGYSCGYLCETLKRDKWKNIQNMKSPTMYLIRWKSYEKYKGVKRSIVNQIGKTGSCIGGAAHYQVRCREDFTQSFGCSMNELSIAPPTYNLGDSKTCRAFTNDGDAAQKDWVQKMSSGWFGLSGSESAAAYRGTADLAKQTKSCKYTKRGPVVQEFIQATRKARGFFVVASLRPLVVLFHPGVTWEDEAVDTSTAATMQAGLVKVGRKDVQKKEFRAVDSDDQVAKRMREVVGFIMSAAQASGLESRKGRFQVFSADFALPEASEPQLLDVTGEPLQVSYPGSGLSPQIWTSLYQTIEQLQTAPPPTLERLRLSAGWELLRMPEWSATKNNPCQVFASPEREHHVQKQLAALESDSSEQEESS